MKRGRGPDELEKESQRQEIEASSFDDAKAAKFEVDTLIRHLIGKDQADKTIVYQRNNMQHHAEWEDGVIRDASSKKE
jgi:hypothetical protein